MNVYDFQAVMVLALVITGAVWAIDAILWAPKRKLQISALAENAGSTFNEERLSQAAKEPWYVEYAKSFFPIILIVLLLRSFLVEPFKIPSGSMMPTLLVGDFILVSKFSYGVRLPVVGSKIIDTGEPQRGDVVVFRYPKDPSVDYIKRVIGLPGDRIGYYNKTVHVNGKPMIQDPVGVYQGIGSGLMMSGSSIRLEHLDEVSHNILIRNSMRSVEGEYIVPEGNYFVMGDNRDNSNDSRFWGTVPEENLVGKAFMIWMNWDSGVDWSRIGSKIK